MADRRAQAVLKNEVSAPRGGASTTLERARAGVIVTFGVNGFVLASWFARIPDVRARLDLGAGQLSLLLLAISAGSVVSLPLAGRVADRLGAPSSVRLGVAVAMPGVSFAGVAVQSHAPTALAAVGLFLLGLGIGLWDVAQNLEGTGIERRFGRSIVPVFHGAFSIGTVLGAALGALLTYLRVPVGVHVPVVGAVGLVCVLRAVRGFLSAESGSSSVPGSATTSRLASTSAWLEPRMLLLGVMVFAAAFTEGSANDWMAVAFVDGHGVPKSVGVVALGVFLTFMTAARMLGAHLLDRYGRVRVLRVQFAAAAVGSGLVVFSDVWLAFVGAAIWGVGASLGFPVAQSAAADDRGRAAARLSMISTVGYSAFLVGPPLIGLLGDHVGVLRALVVVGFMSFVALFVAPVARQQRAAVDDAPTM